MPVGEPLLMRELERDAQVKEVHIWRLGEVRLRKLANGKRAVGWKDELLPVFAVVRIAADDPAAIAEELLRDGLEEARSK
jgi:hypothetical protein